MCPAKDFNKSDEEKKRDQALRKDPFLIRPGRGAPEADPKQGALRDEIWAAARKSAAGREPDEEEWKYFADMEGISVAELKARVAKQKAEGGQS